MGMYFVSPLELSVNKLQNIKTHQTLNKSNEELFVDIVKSGINEIYLRWMNEQCRSTGGETRLQHVEL